MVENVIQMKSEIMKNADMSLKNIMYAKRLYLESCYM